MGWKNIFKKVGLGVAGVFTGGATWGMLAADIAGDVIGGIAQSKEFLQRLEIGLVQCRVV